MIQRIQTVFLILGVIAMTLLFIPSFDLADLKAGILDENPIWADGSLDVADSITLIVLTGVTILMGLVSVLLFADRSRQRIIVLVSMLFALLFIGVSLYLRFTTAPTEATVVDTGAFMPVFALIFDTLALRYIRRDDKIVRSMDRLR